MFFLLSIQARRLELNDMRSGGMSLLVFFGRVEDDNGGALVPVSPFKDIEDVLDRASTMRGFRNKLLCQETKGVQIEWA
jgi:hypothetical protein